MRMFHAAEKIRLVSEPEFDVLSLNYPQLTVWFQRTKPKFVLQSGRSFTNSVRWPFSLAARGGRQVATRAAKRGSLDPRMQVQRWILAFFCAVSVATKPTFFEIVAGCTGNAVSMLSRKARDLLKSEHPADRYDSKNDDARE